MLGSWLTQDGTWKTGTNGFFRSAPASRNRSSLGGVGQALGVATQIDGLNLGGLLCLTLLNIAELFSNLGAQELIPKSVCELREL